MIEEALKGNYKMPMYVAEFRGKVDEWGSVTLEADDLNQADEYVAEHIREAYPDLSNVEIETLKEI